MLCAVGDGDKVRLHTVEYESATSAGERAGTGRGRGGGGGGSGARWHVRPAVGGGSLARVLASCGGPWWVARGAGAEADGLRLTQKECEGGLGDLCDVTLLYIYITVYCYYIYVYCYN